MTRKRERERETVVLAEEVSLLPRAKGRARSSARPTERERERERKKTRARPRRLPRRHTLRQKARFARIRKHALGSARRTHTKRNYSFRSVCTRGAARSRFDDLEDGTLGLRQKLICVCRFSNTHTHTHTHTRVFAGTTRFARDCSIACRSSLVSAGTFPDSIRTTESVLESHWTRAYCLNGRSCKCLDTRLRHTLKVQPSPDRRRAAREHGVLRSILGQQVFGLFSDRNTRPVLPLGHHRRPRHQVRPCVSKRPGFGARVFRTRRAKERTTAASQSRRAPFPTHPKASLFFSSCSSSSSSSSEASSLPGRIEEEKNAVSFLAPLFLFRLSFFLRASRHHVRPSSCFPPTQRAARARVPGRASDTTLGPSLGGGRALFSSCGYFFGGGDTRDGGLSRPNGPSVRHGAGACPSRGPSCSPIPT